jgi:hypothetical protein
MKLLALIALTVTSTGCMHTAALVEQLKNDPATVHLSIQTIYGSILLDRSFPTNWVQPK